MADARKIRVGLSERDSEYLKKIAADLGLSETEVLRKGLQLMALYAKQEGELLYRDGDQEKELYII